MGPPRAGQLLNIVVLKMRSGHGARAYPALTSPRSGLVTVRKLSLDGVPPGSVEPHHSPMHTLHLYELAGLALLYEDADRGEAPADAIYRGSASLSTQQLGALLVRLDNDSDERRVGSASLRRHWPAASPSSAPHAAARRRPEIRSTGRVLRPVAGLSPAPCPRHREAAACPGSSGVRRPRPGASPRASR
jgi:hypothetical protein